jgi:hypothetical protein
VISDFPKPKRGYGLSKFHVAQGGFGTLAGSKARPALQNKCCFDPATVACCHVSNA